MLPVIIHGAQQAGNQWPPTFLAGRSQMVFSSMLQHKTEHDLRAPCQEGGWLLVACLLGASLSAISAVGHQDVLFVYLNDYIMIS